MNLFKTTFYEFVRQALGIHGGASHCTALGAACSSLLPSQHSWGQGVRQNTGKPGSAAAAPAGVRNGQQR